MWTKIGMAVILSAFFASAADLGHVRAADGRATEGGTSGNGGTAVGGGNGPSGTALGGGDRSVHTQPSTNETSPGMTSPDMSGGAGSGSGGRGTGSSTGATGSGTAPASPR